MRGLTDTSEMAVVDVEVRGTIDRERPAAPRKSVTVHEARRCLSGLVGVVVDDDTETFGRIFVSLDHVGCRVRLARRYVQGEKMVRELRPSFVIVGTSIDGSATGLMRAIKKHAATSSTMVIALASAENRHERRRLLQNGFDGYLAKPIDLHLFAQEIVTDVPAIAELRTPLRGNS